eukprot:m51a1_g687 hypothetical protein (951) ;mRNA; f:322611-326513
MEFVRVKKSGFHSFVFVNDSQRALCTFKDGGVGLYDLRKKDWEFLRKMGHMETIFDCKFKPGNYDVLATASFDGSVKIWDALTMEPIDSLDGHEGVVYCISWEPDTGSRLLACTSKGAIYLWDVAKNKLLSRMAIHSLPEGTAVHKYKLGKLTAHPAYGCSWSPKEAFLAVGSQDGVVRVYDIHKKGETPIAILKGHTARVFNTAWSTLMPDFLASCSDDNTGTSVVLSGHADNVRALAWSSEVPNWLLSGSWDGTIRLWDSQTAKCLRVCYDHHADVYGLDVNPHRPFIFASSSRDTTARIWSMEDEVSELKLKAIAGLPWSQLCNTTEAVWDSKGAIVALCGKLSHAFPEKLKANLSEQDKQRLISNYFSGIDGTTELWDLVVCSLTGQQCPMENRVIHTKDIMRKNEARCIELEAVRSQAFIPGIGAARKEDRLAEAAVIRLRLGQFKEYCEIQIELDNWYEAIAIAPAVSMQYWQELCARFSAVLVDKGKQDAERFILAAGDPEKTADFYCDRGRVQDAILTALVYAAKQKEQQSKASASKVSHDKRLSQSQLVPPPASPGGRPPSPSRDAAAVTPLVRKLCDIKAMQYFEDGQPVLAACSHLSVGDTHRALQKLTRGCEFDLAYAVVRALNVPADHVHVMISRKAESLGLWDLAAELLRQTREASQRLALLCVRHAAKFSAEESSAFFQKALLRPKEAFADSAAAAEALGNSREATLCYLACGEQKKAIDIGVAFLKAELAKPEWDVTPLNEILEVLSSANLTRAELLAIAAYVGCFNAVWLGYVEMIPHLLRIFKKLVKDNSIQFPFDASTVAMLQVVHNCTYLDTRAKKLQEAIEGLPDAFRQVSVPWSAYLQQATTEKLAELKANSHLRANNVVKPLGSALPSRRPGATISAITGEEIRGPCIEVERRVISLAEAFMWMRINPFPPFGLGRLDPWATPVGGV